MAKTGAARTPCGQKVVKAPTRDMVSSVVTGYVHTRG